jgi:hypothetical protein
LQELGLTLPVAQQPPGARITMLFAKRSGAIVVTGGAITLLILLPAARRDLGR